jgi:hypothetical protein
MIARELGAKTHLFTENGEGEQGNGVTDYFAWCGPGRTEWAEMVLDLAGIAAELSEIAPWPYPGREMVLVCGPIVHAQADGEWMLPCCSRTPFEVPRYNRMTLHPELVTCRPEIRPL